MRKVFSLSMNGERKTEISTEEIEDNGIDDESDFYYDEDDEPEERGGEVLIHRPAAE